VLALVGAARTQAPVRFTEPAGHWPAVGHTPSWRGPPSGQRAAQIPRMLSGTVASGHVTSPRARGGRVEAGAAEATVGPAARTSAPRPTALSEAWGSHARPPSPQAAPQRLCIRK